jgi:hypothetical protein
VECAALFVRKVVAFVIRDEVEDRAVSQSRRFIEDDAPVLNPGSEGLHTPTIRASPRAPQPRNIARTETVAVNYLFATDHAASEGLWFSLPDVAGDTR